MSYKRVEGSFRDPSGHVYKFEGKIYRTIKTKVKDDYEVLRDSGVYEKLIEAGELVFTKEVPSEGLNIDGEDVEYLLEHERMPLISYPYEWSFNALKAAALFHLELQKKLLGSNVALCDSSAYNIQFRGGKPIFIDFLSLRPYKDGDYWLGHRQFCEHFLHPLLLRALCGVSYNSWLRGSPEGISGADLLGMIPFWKKINPRFFLHLLLPEWLKNSIDEEKSKEKKQIKPLRGLPKSAYLGLLNQLHRWIQSLDAPKSKRSTWDDYTLSSSYSGNEVAEKINFVKKFVQSKRPNLLLDIGCNTGEYSEIALKNGATSVIGIDSDPHACDGAFERARVNNLNISVLQVDISNPSPSQGWRHEELQSFAKRVVSDGMIALAVLHHLVIGKNIPLVDAINNLMDFSSEGVIEFVGKDDKQVKKMLQFREDIFLDYNKENFISIVGRRAEIVEWVDIQKTNRSMVWYRCFKK